MRSLLLIGQEQTVGNFEVFRYGSPKMVNKEDGIYSIQRYFLNFNQNNLEILY